MKLNATLSLVCLLVSSVSLAETAEKTLVCELKDAVMNRVLDQGSETLDNAHILFLVGSDEVTGMVRDVAQAASGDRNLQLQLNYNNGVESSRSHAETTYIAELAPVNTTLAEASIELGHNERRYQLRCFLQ
jgi:hypothetical protein